jgi:predicted ATP-grasp superfamily ATP-dependent carboligase
MDKQLVTSEKENLIKCIQNYVTIDDNLKLINEKTKILKEKKNNLAKAICSYVEDNNINKNIKISDGTLKINEKKDYTPLSYSYLEDCLTEIIKDDNKVSYIIDYLKDNREIKTSLEIKRIKNERN